MLATGGGIVSQTETYDLLLSRCLTIWLRTSPEEHMQRVSAQGDLRPMAGSAEAMEDLRRILAAREPQYMRADHVVDTAGQAEEDSFRALREPSWIAAAEARLSAPNGTPGGLSPARPRPSRPPSALSQRVARDRLDQDVVEARRCESTRRPRAPHAQYRR